MTPKERVLTTLAHREPDRIPWGEHSIDYNVYEDILGRETLVQAKFRRGTLRPCTLWELSIITHFAYPPVLSQISSSIGK